MQSQRSSQKRAVKEKTRFIELQNMFFFILTPLTSSVHNFLIYFFKLSNLNCSEIVILSSTNHFCNSKGNRIIFKDFLRGSKKSYELFEREFSAKTTPPTGGGA
jgi:hypothetical protein